MINLNYLEKEASKIINLYQTKNFGKVIEKCKIFTKKFPEHVVFFNAMALSYHAISKTEDGLKVLNVALSYHQNNILILNNIGLLNSKINNNELAREYYDKALLINENFIDALVNKAQLELKVNKINESERLLLKAKRITKAPLQNEVIDISLGQIYQQKGDFDKSITFFKRVIEVNPQNGIAHKAISVMHSYKNKNDTHLKHMENQLEKAKDPHLLYNLFFSLGKAYEDIGDHDKSFYYLDKGNNILDKKYNYEIENDLRLFNNLKKFFAKKNNFNLDGHKKFIFIVGMPRSGTTLTEQIISSHSKIFGSGELPFLDDAIKKYFLDKNLFNSNKLSNDDFGNIKNYYLERINSFNNENKIVTDKAPLNFRWIGFIQILFPGSIIVHCYRNPMDNCFSNFKNSFDSKELSFGNNMQKLGEFYNLYKDLMIFWNKQYPGKIYNLSYEKLTNNHEDETRKLINFCGLDWEDACLSHYKNKNKIATASIAQARQPIYQSSINKWKNYSKYLSRLKKIVDIEN